MFEMEPAVVPLRTLTIADSVKLCSLLQRHAQKIAKRKGAALAIVIEVDEDGTPSLHVFGKNPMRLSAHDVAMYCNDAVYVIGAKHDPEKTYDDEMKERWQRHADSERRHRERELAKAPWRCEFCDKGYKTERGAVAHERTCITQPREAEHRWRGFWEGKNHCTCGWSSPGVLEHHRSGPANAAMRTHFNERARGIETPELFGPRAIDSTTTGEVAR